MASRLPALTGRMSNRTVLSLADTDVLTYTGDGAETEYSITVGYRETTQITVEVNGVEKVADTDYTIADDVLTFTVAPAAGVTTTPLVVATHPEPLVARVQPAGTVSVIV